MLVFLEQNLVVLSVPKTGSTAIERALRDDADIVTAHTPALKHMTVRRYRVFVQPMLEKLCGQSPELVAVMREPIDWLGSWFRYRQRRELDGHPKSTRDMTFSAFAEAFMRESPPDLANVGRQARFLGAREGVSPVDHLFRYEDAPGVLGFLESRLGRPIRTTRENVSPAGTLHLDSATELQLRSFLINDYALYDNIPGPSQRNSAGG